MSQAAVVASFSMRAALRLPVPLPGGCRFLQVKERCALYKSLTITSSLNKDITSSDMQQTIEPRVYDVGLGAHVVRSAQGLHSA